MSTVDSPAMEANRLLDYEDLRERLTIGVKNPRKPSLRTVKSLVNRYRAILRPVRLGHSTVGFRPARVEAFLSHLEEQR